MDYHYTLNIGEEKQGEELFQLLAQKRIPITKFEIKKPSLHDIFIEKVEEGGDK